MNEPLRCKLLGSGQNRRLIGRFSSTMYMQNRRDSSKFYSYILFQNCNGLIMDWSNGFWDRMKEKYGSGEWVL